MTMLVMAGMTLAATAAIGYPLLRRQTQWGRDDTPEQAMLLERKESLYEGLRDLELDRRTDKVSAADYKVMRADYEIEAARVLERMEVGNGHDTGHGSHVCPGCRTEIPAGARFCPECGQRVVSPACPACGVDARSGARFCGSCGTSLTAAPQDPSPSVDAP